MNIIHVLVHGNADGIRPSDMDNKLLYMLAFSPVIRPSDMDNKLLYMLAFSPVYPVCQMYIWLYIHIYNPTSLPYLLGHIVDRIILT